MAPIHVLEKADDGEHQLVFHFAVPTGNNSVPNGAGGPVSWQEAVVAWLAGSSTSVLPDGGPEAEGGGEKGTISTEELSKIQSGEVLERSYPYCVDSGGTTDAERAVSIRAFYQKKKASITAELARQLDYFGAILDEV